jgi:hypothetical protein
LKGHDQESLSTRWAPTTQAAQRNYKDLPSNRNVAETGFDIISATEKLAMVQYMCVTCAMVPYGSWKEHTGMKLMAMPYV